jgi:hypothetical protein
MDIAGRPASRLRSNLNSRQHADMFDQLVVVSDLLLLGMFHSPVTVAAQPFNLLIIHDDDWRHGTLGNLGKPVVQTPQLDRLAGLRSRFVELKAVVK